MKKSTKEALGFAVFYSLIVIAITSIPIHFYISLLLQHSKLSQQLELIEYVKNIENRIYNIKKGDSSFIFPRSLLFSSEILDKNGEVIFSLLDKKMLASPHLYHKSELAPNILDARYLVTIRPLLNASVVMEAVILTGMTLLFVFLLTYFLIRRSLLSYEEANTMMERFFKDAMHELKTPLGIIQLNLDALRVKLTDNKHINRSIAAIKSLSSVYDDIEYLIKNKKIEFSKEDIDLSSFTHERALFFEDLANIKEIALKSSVQSDIYVRLNRIELQRVIDNTLSNAIKYSPQKTTVTLTLKKDGQNAILSIKDQGVGIKDTKAIFVRYYRGDAIKGGFGIGLSIVKSICDKNGITIKVNSKEGEGSEFIYSFFDTHKNTQNMIQ